MERQNGASGIFAPGETFEKYTIVKLLGRGGMGAVYLVRHNVLDSLFALKVLSPEVAGRNTQFVDRFIREAKLACKIKHPNLIAVHDAGKNRENGMYYLIMDYVSGGSVRDLLKIQGRILPEKAIAITRQVASALKEACRYKMVHRDIKPDNIMFAADGTAKLADLGIAKSANDQDTMLTVDASVFGTPAYMSPEQAMDSSRVDCRADIYSLGIVLFEMLAGQRPYRGSGTIEILSQVLKDEEIPDVRKFSPGISAEVAALVRDMTSKQLFRRIASPDELIKRIQQITDSGSCGDARQRKSVIPFVVPAVTMPTIVQSGTVPDVTVPMMAQRGAVPEVTMPTIVQSGTATDVTVPMMAQRGAVPEVTMPTIVQSGTAPDVTVPTIVQSGAAPEVTMPTMVQRGTAPAVTTPTPRGAEKTEREPVVEMRNTAPEEQVSETMILSPLDVVEKNSSGVSAFSLPISAPDENEDVVVETVVDDNGKESSFLTWKRLGRWKSSLAVIEIILLVTVISGGIYWIVSPEIGGTEQDEIPEKIAGSHVVAESKPEPAVPVESDMENEPEREPESTVTAIPEEASGSHGLIPGAVVMVGHFEGKIPALKASVETAYKYPVVFREPESSVNYRQQLKEIIKSKPRCVILAPAAKYAKQDISLNNFENLILNEAILLRDNVIPFAFMLSENKPDVPKTGWFNDAIKELCNSRSITVIETQDKLLEAFREILPE